MRDIRNHIHVYLLLIASIILGLGGLLSIWRMGTIERQYDRWRLNQVEIIEQNDQVVHEHAEILATLRRMDSQAVLRLPSRVPAPPSP